MSAITVDSIKIQERNFKLLYLEAFLASSQVIAQAFAGAFAIRLCATNAEIGLMSSIPALIVILVSIPIGRFMHKTQRKLFWAVGGISLQRLGYVLLAISPWVKLTSATPSLFFVGLTVLLYIPLQFFAIGYIGIFIDLIPANRDFPIRTVVEPSLVSGKLPTGVRFLWHIVIFRPVRLAQPEVSTQNIPGPTSRKYPAFLS